MPDNQGARAYPSGVTDHHRTSVRVEQGTLVGLANAKIARYLGVPFAAPCVGRGRFRPPERPLAWDKEFEAFHVGPQPMQRPGQLEAMLNAPPRPQSEDSLSLNIYAPTAPGPHPVMVWIHGGAFVTGTGGIPWYEGSNLATRGVVVVTINYRLGAFGWLALDQILGDEFAGSGNLGLLDQVAALRWVRDNVAAFGGDPEQVTVFGESAGAMSTSTLLGTPAARGLFSRAIAQSGACHNVSSLATAHGMADRVLAELQLSDPRDILTVDQELLADASDAVWAAATNAGAAASTSHQVDTNAEEHWSLPYQPVVDGVVLPVAPLGALQSGASDEVALLLGTNLDEWRLFSLADKRMATLTHETARRWTEKTFAKADPTGVRGGAVYDNYRKLRPDAAPSELWNVITGDQVFRIPAIRVAEARAREGSQPTWMYRFDARSQAWGGILGACHALEIPFVFDNIDATGIDLLLGQITEEHRALATRMADLWVGFARGEALDWDTYDPWTRVTRLFDLEKDSTANDPDGLERLMWDGVL